MSEETKKKIAQTVRDYIALYPEEYKAFQAQMKTRQEDLISDYAEVEGDHVMTRALLEVPETLNWLIKHKLSDEEWDEFTKDDASKTSPGQRWFARKFPAFRVTKDV